MSPDGPLPFARYRGGGRELLGIPRQGDGTARHGYGPQVFEQCGHRCAYCGIDLGSTYEDWLRISVDHVVPVQTKAKGYPREWIEDTANQVTCCRPCNDFTNDYTVLEPVPPELDAFLELRDRVFREKRELALRRHARERDWYRDRLVPTLYRDR